MFHNKFHLRPVGFAQHFRLVGALVLKCRRTITSGQEAIFCNTLQIDGQVSGILSGRPVLNQSVQQLMGVSQGVEYIRQPRQMYR